MSSDVEMVATRAHGKDHRAIQALLQEKFDMTELPGLARLSWQTDPTFIELYIGTYDGVDVLARWHRTFFDKFLRPTYVRRLTTMATAIERHRMDQITFAKPFDTIMSSTSNADGNVTLLNAFIKGCFIMKEFAPRSFEVVSNTFLGDLKRAINRVLYTKEKVKPNKFTVPDSESEEDPVSSEDCGIVEVRRVSTTLNRAAAVRTLPSTGARGIGGLSVSSTTRTGPHVITPSPPSELPAQAGRQVIQSPSMISRPNAPNIARMMADLPSSDCSLESTVPEQLPSKSPHYKGPPDEPLSPGELSSSRDRPTFTPSDGFNPKGIAESAHETSPTQSLSIPETSTLEPKTPSRTTEPPVESADLISAYIEHDKRKKRASFKLQLDRANLRKAEQEYQVLEKAFRAKSIERDGFKEKVETGEAAVEYFKGKMKALGERMTFEQGYELGKRMAEAGKSFQQAGEKRKMVDQENGGGMQGGGSRPKVVQTGHLGYKRQQHQF